jgi:peptidoglycan/LPS O-acetylase OafA/YrhL
VAIIAGSIYFRYLNFEDFKTLVYHTFSVMGVLGIGCLLGYFCFAKKFLQSSIFIPKLVNSGIYVFGLTMIFLYPIYFTSSLGIAFFTTLSGFFFAYIIFEQVFVKNPLFNLGRVKFLNYWGKYTYDLYCKYPIGILILFNITKIIKLEDSIYWVSIGENIISLLLSMIIAWSSYHVVEKHFLKLKRRITGATSPPLN